jgi:hypothetical protein
MPVAKEMVRRKDKVYLLYGRLDIWNFGYFELIKKHQAIFSLVYVGPSS